MADAMPPGEPVYPADDEAGSENPRGGKGVLPALVVLALVSGAFAAYTWHKGRGEVVALQEMLEAEIAARDALEGELKRVNLEMHQLKTAKPVADSNEPPEIENTEMRDRVKLLRKRLRGLRRNKNRREGRLTKKLAAMLVEIAQNNDLDGREEQAMEIYERYLELRPDGKDAADIRESVKSIREGLATSGDASQESVQ